MTTTIEAPAATPKAPKPGRRQFWLGVLVGLVIAGLITVAVWSVRGSGASNSLFLMRNRSTAGVTETASGLQYKVLTKGKGGASPTDTDVTLVTYEGKLLDGTTFDKSQQPTPMPVAGVVPGFAEALKLMHKGEKARFWIKPSLGYGDKSAGPIPANSILVFDVELLDFLPESVIRQMQMQQQMQGGGAAGAPAPETPKGR